MGRRPLILFDRGSGHRGLVLGLFRQAGIVSWTTMEMDSTEAAKKTVEEGLGIAMPPRLSVDRELKLGVLAEVRLRDTEPPRRRIALIYRRARRPSRTVVAFLNLLHETHHFGSPAGLGQPSPTTNS